MALACDVWRQKIAALDRILALLLLNRARIDQPSMKCADEGTIGPHVEPAVGLAGHHRIEEHQPAASTPRRGSRVPVTIAMRQADEHRLAAKVASFHADLGLRSIVKPQCGNPLEARSSAHPRHQYVSRFSTRRSQVASVSAIRVPALPSP